MTCVRSVSYRFLHNSDIFWEVMPKRGIRQGDHISPYLYILSVEGLSAIIGRNEEAWLIHGYTIARGAPPISHLLFFDDCYFFFRALETEACSMKRILQRYEMVSGQVVNNNKSAIIFSTNTGRADREKVCASIGVLEIDKPGKYLGLPIFVGRNKIKMFGFLVDRVGQKVQG
ncbi:uncharacterized protein LOC141686066 [Apium graveolens]|uniref:uncharacterized protein LOC141686066 n=1 Tax=Apium graveolens TaxID=4045 RepID=UPI003D7A7E12